MQPERGDQYGGCIENKSRFAQEKVQAVADAIGADWTAIRFSPWSTYNSMRMEDPASKFSDIIKKPNPFKLGYLHLVESRVTGNADVECVDKLGYAMDLWNGSLLIAGGYTQDSAE